MSNKIKHHDGSKPTKGSNFNAQWDILEIRMIETVWILVDCRKSINQFNITTKCKAYVNSHPKNCQYRQQHN